MCSECAMMILSMAIVLAMADPGLFDLDDLLPDPMQETFEHGEVFTRRWVVETILDLVGYTVERDLAGMLVVEPACGSGAFLGPIAERLSASCRVHQRSLLDAVDAIESFDLLDRNVQATQELLTRQLQADGWESAQVDKVVSAWVSQGDYLLRPQSGQLADFVVGNPPYIRLEDVPDARMNAYRAACPTMGGRADIYVGFYEVGLQRLKPGGRLGFICADRWMRNQYGRQLRELVTSCYSMDLVLTMHDVDAFHDQVSAYPAITIITNCTQGPAVAADTTSEFSALQAREFSEWVLGSGQLLVKQSSYQAARLPHWFPGGESWPAATAGRLAMLEDLSDRFPLLEDKSTGTRVGIGVASGADQVYVARDRDSADVEADRLLPLAMVRDTASGVLDWHGTYLVNPWDDKGRIVALADYPRLARYFEQHGAALRSRYTAGKDPSRWYKTIDKVDYSLTVKPKLLLPDMKMTISPVLDPGGLYPHHNLYYIISDTWDMRVLGGLLLSKVAEAFVSAYAVKMRGGTLRFQAQYLRKIRVPHPDDISVADRTALAEAFDCRDVEAATQAALSAYRLTELPE
jgi:adenine-specific DNA-methyltransferase